ncbi:MAG: PP2C family protein-serine/threonine phosphatase, partial [Acidimicrobiaceae bacterium]
LVDEVTDEAIEKCVKQKIDPQKVADQLVAIANANGGRDNITVIVVDVIADGANSPTSSSKTPTTTRQKKPVVRKLVISGTISVAAVVAIVFLSSYLRSGYFVAYENSDSDARVLIYRGKNFLWVNPTIEADSTLT